MYFFGYFLLSLVLFLIAATATNFILSVFMFWCASSFFLVSLAYAFNTPYIFRKKITGRMPFYMKGLFIPFLACIRFYNYCARKRDTVPAIQAIDHNLYLARRLLPSDIPVLKEQGITAVLDVTAEFNSLNLSLFHEDFEQEIQYLNLPVLDHSVPSEKQILQALHWLEQCHKNNQKVVVHCALGRGRSVFVVAAYLWCKSPHSSLDEIMQKIQKIRMTSRLNRTQYKTLMKYQKSHLLQIKNSACLIVNSVSGGGKWQQHKTEILALLSPYFDLAIKTTSEQHDGAYWADKAISEGFDVLIACGGDGTVTEVASRLINSQQVLGIIPLGTTNALSHFLWGIDAKISPIESACMNIIEGVTSKVDTARCNDKLVLLLAGLGFEYQMIKEANREEKNNLGQLAYLQGLWTAISSNKENNLLVTFDEETEQEISVNSLTVANAAPFTTVLAQGGGSPDIQDGQLDVTWLPHSEQATTTAYNLVELAISCIANDKAGKHIQHKKVKKILIRWADEQEHEFVIDGEVFAAHYLNIEVQPLSLKVIYDISRNEKTKS